MKKPTLVILAAGMASRYGKMKQIEGFGPNNETIMDYSIYDAIQTGFGKVVFVIREEFHDKFKEIIEPKYGGKIEIDYAFQEMDDYVPADAEINPERAKPWGTAHAVLCSRDKVDGNFCVINADDFYGRDGFQKAHDFLVNECNDELYGIIGYTLSNTLSKNGSVSRGVCQVDADNNLTSIAERTKIYWKGEKVAYLEDDQEHEVDASSPVSMNFWCFSPGVYDLSEKLFQDFVRSRGNELKSEFFIPIVADYFIQNDLGNIKVIQTEATWFGVTYPEDAPLVQESISQQVAQGAYPEKLF